MRGSLISAPYLGFLLKNQAKIKIANVIMTDHHLGKVENAKFDHAHKISQQSQSLNLFDITATSIPIPRRLPTKEIFEKYIKENQFDRLMPIVFFDEHMHFAARAWFTFRYFGFKRVYVLDGGFHKWHHHHNLDKNESHVFEDLILQDKPKDEVTTLSTNEVAVVSYLKQHNDPKADDWLILDARDTPRFKQGHIPGAINIQFSEYLNDDYTMKSDDQLKEVYKKHGVDFNKKIINTCQTGKLSCIAILAQEILKKKQLLLYDGSYEEWKHEHPKTKQ